MSMCHFDIEDRTYKEIRAHLLLCDPCRLKYERMFKFYKAGTPFDDTVPLGIESFDEYLERLLMVRAAQSENEEFLKERLLEKLQDPEVQRCIQRVLISQTRLVKVHMLGAPEFGIVVARGVRSSLQRLEIMLGRRLFNYYMTDDTNIEAPSVDSIANWYEAVVSK